ncbi:MAG TPA: MFS transporter [Paucimonas sp.]|nr:MFS transporter [Paucimonas sp.]
MRIFLARLFTGDALWSNRDFRRLWVSSVLNTFGREITGLAIPLTAVLLLQATPAQMGALVALEMVPFALFSLPVGVWLDRRAKYPIMLWNEFLFPFVLVSIPVAWWLGMLTMTWMYVVGFLTGVGFVIGGGAQQVFVTHLVGRDHLIDAHSKLGATDSLARLIGPGMGGVLVQALTAPFAVLIDAIGFLISWRNLSRIRNRDADPAPTDSHPLRDMLDGLLLIRRHPVLWPLAWGIGIWQFLFNGYMALNVLFATRELGMSPGLLGTMQMFGGLGALLSTAAIKPMNRRFGTGVMILIGLIGTMLAWIALPCIPAALFGSPLASALCYGAVMLVFDCSVMLLLMPYLALRQKVTPDEFLGRMTATMRFLTVAAAPLGALGAGWVAEHFGIRAGLAVIAGGCIGLSALLLFASPLRHIRDDRE